MSQSKLKAAAAILGREGGLRGGLARTPAKVAAGRKNSAKARAVLAGLVAARKMKKSVNS